MKKDIMNHCSDYIIHSVCSVIVNCWGKKIVDCDYGSSVCSPIGTIGSSCCSVVPVDCKRSLLEVIATVGCESTLVRGGDDGCASGFVVGGGTIVLNTVCWHHLWTT